MDKKKIILLALLLALIAAFFVFDLGSYLTLENLKQQRDGLQQWRDQAPLLSSLGFFLVYVLVTALSLPGATVMTLAIGAIFGLVWGFVLVSFASTIGATLAFLVARFLFRDAVQQRFGDRLQSINAGMAKDGALYLFSLRLVPLFPFFVINLVLGLTPIRTWTYYWVSQLGMLAGTLVYVNAGTQLAGLDSLSGILSPALIGSFVLLGIFPLIAKRIVTLIKRRRALAGWNRPRSFDRNLVVIGGGSAGLVSAYIAAAVKAKVSLIEKHKMGGDCLNTGCVPSKALIRSSRLLAQSRRAQEWGFDSMDVKFDFGRVMERVQRVVKQVEPHDSVKRYSRLGVDVIEGEARITSPYTVEVDGRELTTRNIIVATGARPFVPPIPGLDQIDYLTSDNLWQLRELPQRLLVLGGGPIGCELSQAFARFGAKVTMVEMAPRLMMREDEDVAALVQARFEEEGIEVLAGHRATEFLIEDGEKRLRCDRDGDAVIVPFDQVLVAVGRRPNTSGFGLEELGLPLNPNGTIQVDDYLQSPIPSIYACGDVAGPYQFTHTAAHQAWYAAVNSLFGGFRRFRVDYSVIPFATFTDPEVARVGLNEQEAQQQGVSYEVTRFDLSELDRAIAEGEAHGMVKVLTVPGKDRILGATIVGENAGELIGEFTAAMKPGFGFNKILGTIHIYPTLLEANKYAAGEWKRAHAPQKLLEWVGRFHAWRRG
ncbi:FAD-dependent oxidoreductase [endosymbiont of Ridgeia piscesae]|jgi:dihydrolipoamide dehydrogenase|uniref:Dihydrolipoamide dehydrogenase n=1 Tax=endosymbiont of Ridgeia piscesae TaxID=54398 RepID=A0A0T5YZ01_9GAMM|nr:FAD-dependent oxidoreductase [endosymbiont of Ridgeia piscesae]KRT55741.1 dihydrolipoamide dehydrogenase [endosymbiont of Ridgeia piscesae]KRT59730.1 dihydrolipoamide dehydrogenase [endosymbiont of Ridgeia piscesae]